VKKIIYFLWYVIYFTYLCNVGYDKGLKPHIKLDKYTYK